MQDKLANRDPKYRQPRAAGLILSGLLICGHCGMPMVGTKRLTRDGTSELECFCTTYPRHVTAGAANCSLCGRHSVKQSEITELLKQHFTDVLEQLETLDKSARSRDLRPRLTSVESHVATYWRAGPVCSPNKSSGHSKSSPRSTSSTAGSRRSTPRSSFHHRIETGSCVCSDPRVASWSWHSRNASKS